MKFVSKILFSFLFTAQIFSQLEPGARQIALSNSDIALSDDAFAIFNNPSGISQIHWREIGLYYSPAPFGLKELANAYITYVEPTSFGNIGIGVMTYGFELYRESKFKLAYSYKYNEKFFAGLGIKYQAVSIENYGTDFAFVYDISGLFYLTKYLHLGFIWQNIIRSTYGNEENQIPSEIITGLSYAPLEDLTLNGAIEKDLIFSPSLRFSIEYRIIEYLTLRSGIATEPGLYSGGIGINYDLFQVDYAFVNHSVLGLTHQFGVIIRFQNNPSS